MHGIVIEHRPCPRCHNQRTLQLGAIWFCFNCRSTLRRRRATGNDESKLQ